MSESEHTQESTNHTDEEKGDHPDERVSPKEPGLPYLQFD